MQHLAELCALIIELNFGDLAARLFTTLADHGAASLLTLRELTRIPLSRLNNGLSVLTQYHLIVQSDNPYEHSTFQVDWHAAYSLVRADKIKRLVAERHGDLASTMMDDMIHLGLASTAELVDVYANDSDPTTDGTSKDDGGDADRELPNGTANSKHGPTKSIASQKQVHKTLKLLLENGFLLKVGPRSFIPHADLHRDLRAAVVEASFQDGKITGPKKQQEFNLAVNVLKRKWQDEDEFSSQRDLVMPSNKRLKTGASGAKSAKTNGDIVNGVTSHDDDDNERDQSRLPIDMVFRVNYNKCTIALRSQRLEVASRRFLGPITAAVYGALLRVLERRERASRDVYRIEYGDPKKGGEDEENAGGEDDDYDEEDIMLPSAYDWEVMDMLDWSIDLTDPPKEPPKDTDGSASSSNGTKENGHRTQNHDGPYGHSANSSDAEDDEDDDADGKVNYPQRKRRQELIAMHLQRLSEHPKDFCMRMYGGGKTGVDIRALTQTLIQDDMDAMISSRHGQVAGRIVRLLRANGKLDEKQLTNLSLKKVKDVRAILANLQAYTLVDVQELPKDAQRLPQRSSYFWFFDEPRVRELYLQHTYKGMARVLQRIKTERQSDTFRAAVDKAERIDVKGREEKLLAKHERGIVKQWLDVEERLLIELARLDDVVALLRDFSGKDTSLNT